MRVGGVRYNDVQVERLVHQPQERCQETEMERYGKRVAHDLKIGRMESTVYRFTPGQSCFYNDRENLFRLH